MTRDIEPITEAGRLCLLLADAMEMWGAKRPTVGKTWKQDMDRMLRIDKREAEQVERVIRWLFSSSDDVAMFWAPNIGCPGKLRSRWDQMAGQYRRLQKTAKPKQGRASRNIEMIRQRKEQRSIGS